MKLDGIKIIRTEPLNINNTGRGIIVEKSDKILKDELRVVEFDHGLLGMFEQVIERYRSGCADTMLLFANPGQSGDTLYVNGAFILRNETSTYPMFGDIKLISDSMKTSNVQLRNMELVGLMRTAASIGDAKHILVDNGLRVFVSGGEKLFDKIPDSQIEKPEGLVAWVHNDNDIVEADTHIVK